MILWAGVSCSGKAGHYKKNWSWRDMERLPSDSAGSKHVKAPGEKAEASSQKHEDMWGWRTASKRQTGAAEGRRRWDFRHSTMAGRARVCFYILYPLRHQGRLVHNALGVLIYCSKLTSILGKLLCWDLSQRLWVDSSLNLCACGDQGLVLGIFLYHPLPYYLQQGLSRGFYCCGKHHRQKQFEEEMIYTLK